MPFLWTISLVGLLAFGNFNCVHKKGITIVFSTFWGFSSRSWLSIPGQTKFNEQTNFLRGLLGKFSANHKFIKLMSYIPQKYLALIWVSKWNLVFEVFYFSLFIKFETFEILIFKQNTTNKILRNFAKKLRKFVCPSQSPSLDWLQLFIYSVMYTVQCWLKNVNFIL